MEVVAFTDVGYQRKVNEDSYYVNETKKIFAVADGMGGHKAGEIASQTVKKYLENEVDVEEKDLKEVFTRINREIIETAEEHEDCKGMGTTFTMAKVKDGEVLVGHIGDSRAYLIRSRKIMQMTTDHTMVNELLRVKEITPEQAIEHPYRHVLSRALGVEKNIEFEEKSLKLEEDDILLISTDGLHGFISDEEILSVFDEKKYHIKEVGETLLHKALEKGGFDNITFIIAKDIIGDREQD